MTEMLRVDVELETLLANATGAVFSPDPQADTWESCFDELETAFQLSKNAVEAGKPVVYVVHNDDLLGRRGAVGAMIATGLLSAARTLALETAKSGTPVNVLAVDDDTSNEQIALWVERLLETGGPAGEIVHMGRGHLGKALP